MKVKGIKEKNRMICILRSLIQ